MSDDEMKRLITPADGPLGVDECTNRAFGQWRVFHVPTLIKEAFDKGLIRCVDGQIVDSKKVYGATIQLTAEGRDFCGLEAEKVVTPVKAKPKQMEMF